MEIDEKSLLKFIIRDINKKLTYEEILAKYELTDVQLEGLLQMLELEGYEFTKDEGLLVRLNNSHKEKKLKPSIDSLEHLQVCIVSDTHMGNKLEQRTLLHRIYDEAEKRGITTVLHCGDVVDGDYRNKRPAHPYDLFAQGASQQLYNVIENYPQREGITTFFITGSHDNTHYLNGGFNIGEAISMLRPDMKYLGPDQAMFMLDGKVSIMLKHPGGGVSKSLSYKPQEAINKMEGEKPKVLLIGHYHKSYCMYYNEIYTILTPCLTDQTQFMKMNDLQNVVGAVFLDLYVDKKGNIEYFNYDEVRFTDKDVIKNDYLRKVKK